MTLELLPAVDVAQGRAVQRVHHRAGTGPGYGTPLEAALAWQRDGAQWVHLVDLDAAFGLGSNADLLAEVIGVLDVNVELSGGIQDEESLRRALATGCRRVNIGTPAQEFPQWCAEVITRYGDRVTMGLDVRGTALSARGSASDGGDVWEALSRLDRAGCTRYVVTDVNKDGRLEGPNLDLLAQFCTATAAPVVASGGVSTLDDLEAIANIHGVEGAIIGTALYEGAFSLPDALTRVAELHAPRTSL